MLMYHRFSEAPEPFKVSTDIFKRQLEFLNKRYSIIPFHQYLDFLNGEVSQLPPNPLIITIDDGYRDNYDIAFPILQQYEIPAMIFLATDFITRKRWLWSNKLEYILKNSLSKKFEFSFGGDQCAFQIDTFSGWHAAQLAIFNHCRNVSNENKNQLLGRLAKELAVEVPSEVTDEFLPLTWEHIREMHVAGVDFGSHTCSHPICSRLMGGELVDELVDSKLEIEDQLGSVVEVFCYPNGRPEDYSDAVIDAVKDAGYSAAVTTVPGFNLPSGTDPYRLKRLSIGMADFAVMARELTR
jgi:peptidoglycan/xylan/chitin deacetylase (PgdA/CDA1 family)